jgi:hypothetical protein
MYSDKVVAFFDQLMDTQFAGKPFMRHYLDYYFGIYWDLHLGAKGEAIPKQVRQIGEAFNTLTRMFGGRLPLRSSVWVLRDRMGAGPELPQSELPRKRSGNLRIFPNSLRFNDRFYVIFAG